MDTIITPNMDFQTAGTQPARLGRHGEISDMIEKDMTLDVATRLHNKNHNFSNAPTVHDSRHIAPLGLLAKTHPHLMQGKAYQADAFSEAYVSAISMFIVIPETDRAKFIEVVQQCWDEDALYDNERTALASLCSRATGRDMNDFKIMPSAELEEQAKALGMEITDNSSDGKIHVTISDELGSFTATKDSIEFSKHFPGQEKIVPFTRPSDKEAGAMFDAMEPAMLFLRENANQGSYITSEALFNVTVGQVLERLQSTVTRDARLDVAKGLHVQPS